MLVVLLVVIVALSLMFWYRSDTPPAAPANLATEVASYAGKVEPTSVYAGQTAQIAFAAAQKTAVSWQPDAALLNASATWPQGSTRQDLLSGETTWSYTFFSPETDKTALISVLGNEASMVMQGTLNQPAQPVNPGGWTLDSTDAIKQFLNEGGTDFMNNEGVTSLMMTLTADPENGRVQWLIQLAATQALRILTMRIDATSGEILAIDKTA